ncbi:MAG TPA: TetR/AcrR family transcriptional regulator [Stellaceae bacterium]|nr:TetR/AcrR family transcriptional regulator [Stellaceae bacterium]
MINAAEKAFLEKGYHAARMDDVARSAGMSKKTIYQVFSSKEELFEALVVQRLAPLHCWVQPDDRPVVDVLCEILLRCAEFLLSPPQIAILRLIMAEYSRSPELGQIFQREGAGRATSALEHYLSSLEGDGHRLIRDPHEAAKMLLGMSLCTVHWEMMLGIRQTISRVALERRVRWSVEIFLNGIRSAETVLYSVEDKNSFDSLFMGGEP